VRARPEDGHRREDYVAACDSSCRTPETSCPREKEVAVPFFHQQSRDELRRAYLSSWRKWRAGEALAPLEAAIARVIAEHPEYHSMLEAPEAAVKADFVPEGGVENPFLHLGLHLAIREQVSTDRPAGIARIHAQLAARFSSALAAEHRMFEALGATLWEAERGAKPPDESAYLERLEHLLASASRGM
jgi:hypothetical protein